MDINPSNNRLSRMQQEHESVIRQRHQAPETEEDLLAMQEEFLKTNDRPAAAVIRVKPPAVTSDATAGRASIQDDADAEDIPPPLERDIVSLDSDQLPLHPPQVQASASKPRVGSKFLQDRANKGPRTHFATPVGERFEINLNDDNDTTGSTEERKNIHGRHNSIHDEIETEEETLRRLNTAGPSMGQILHEVLEKPAGEAIAPLGPTTTPGLLEPTAHAAKGGFKGKSLFARRLAEAQGVVSTSQITEEPSASGSSTYTPSSSLPSSAAYTSFMSRAEQSRSPSKDVVSSPIADDAVPVRSLRPTTKVSTRPASFSGRASSASTKTSPPLHSVLKKTPDSPHTTLMEQIDEENKQKLANMSQQEIEEERAELLRNLDPELVKKFMRRSMVKRRVSFSEGIKVEDKVLKMHDIKSGRSGSGFQAKRHEEEEGDHPLAMKKRYFSNVPAEPEKLEWMGIEGIEESDVGMKHMPGKSVAPGPQPYTVSESDPPAAHFRFNFSGRIVNEEDVPVHLGLHHHGMDPAKAGYTLSELLHLIRSTVPSQRILPLNVVAKVIDNCKDANFAPFTVRAVMQEQPKRCLSATRWFQHSFGSF
ncbi:RPAP1-like protein [Lobosporangium transversale]|uniref:RPAP1-like protein n=1 Tax=Lobosporangium transversale TaxID=64571 RepID=A0A1Y2GW42_9FUNG|nr:RPAP1-like protein [Lobosporangium transversale]ORZ26489.1 RPAP1-like protein [Lobosporangium transversale]|eukprot:XP_021884254.1 RPAP1-like protein [Lobosporangium transversale]